MKYIDLDVEASIERVINLLAREQRALELVNVCSITWDSNNGGDATHQLHQFSYFNSYFLKQLVKTNMFPFLFLCKLYYQ